MVKSLANMLTINLAAPSGSSAAEKPPARKIMLAFSILSTMVSTDLTIASSFNVTKAKEVVEKPVVHPSIPRY